MTVLVTGGCGFVGSTFVLDWLRLEREPIVNVDALTYAANPLSLKSVENDERYSFVEGDISDRDAMQRVFSEFEPRAVVNFAAESHVDRSIHDADVFLRTNVGGTQCLIDISREFLANGNFGKDDFRFLQVSTDEVYGTLDPLDPAFAEDFPFQPNSPYAASKAAADMFVRAAFHTHGLPALTTHCSNNYGPRQFPEKLIPLVIGNALEGKALPIYGDGSNIRDWLHVSDHCAALREVLGRGRPGERYNIGGENEISNIELVHQICSILDEARPRVDGKSYSSLITFVRDRPGHDRRYAIDNSKICTELGWKPEYNVERGLRETVSWFLNNESWVQRARSGNYEAWIKKNYASESRVL